jgi:hypothetical protein
LTVAQPDDGVVVGGEEVFFSGTFADSSPAAVTVTGATAALDSANYSARVTLGEGQNRRLRHPRRRLRRQPRQAHHHTVGSLHIRERQTLPLEALAAWTSTFSKN